MAAVKFFYVTYTSKMTAVNCFTLHKHARWPIICTVMAIPAYSQPALQVLVTRFLLPVCNNKVSTNPNGSLTPFQFLNSNLLSFVRTAILHYGLQYLCYGR